MARQFIVRRRVVARHPAGGDEAGNAINQHHVDRLGRDRLRHQPKPIWRPPVSST
jgi:hypothetical protein